MAYVNVAEWSPDQVADWIKGLEGVTPEYVRLFLSIDINGQQLLNLTAEDFDKIGIVKIGHQELILEAVGQLRNFHYELDRENLQQLALKLSCAATSVFRDLLNQQDGSKVETQTLSDVANVIAAVKPLASWLDRAPFSSHPDYTERKTKLLKLSFMMATNTQRDRFAESPVYMIRNVCMEMASLADRLIQDVLDPMLLQPATLELATYKKREQDDLKMLPNRNGIHEIVHSIGKIEQGDGIVQVNYQTVVGWKVREVSLLCEESPSDIVLTLKKKPRHTHTYGQIYIKPYRLPSRKRSTPYSRWGTLPSPRPELLVIKNFEMPLPRPSPVPNPQPELSDLEINSSTDDESELSSTPGSPTFDNMSSQSRIFLPKPRSVVQRRNTISGSSPISKRPYISIEQFRRELKNQKYIRHTGSAQMATDPDDISDNLCRRDKSVSCSTGLELSPRPNTCLGVNLNHSKIAKLNNQKLKFSPEDKSPSKSVKFDDEASKSSSPDGRERGRLDKSHSTPAYDFGEENAGDYPLMKEIIPESPTAADCPTVIVHSPEKIDQILQFKKSSEQITSAMSHQQAAKLNSACSHENSKNENIFGEVSPSDNLLDKAKVLETINIALLEHKEKEDICPKKILNCERQTIFHLGRAQNNLEDVDISIKIQAIQNELLEAINEKKILENKLDIPPIPPPRPASTQRPGYVPKLHKPIQKEDIQVIPNIDCPQPVMPVRKDIPLPLNSAIPLSPTHKINFSPTLSNDFKHTPTNLSTTELSSPRTPLMPARSLQVLEGDQKPITPQSKVDTSPYYVKSGDGNKYSVSPANSMVRGLLYTGKSKSLKKKYSILSKRRLVSSQELGPGDVEGFLYQRCRTKNSNSVSWQLKWFVLIDNTFYGFRTKDSQRADCLIFLSGFTVTTAKEVKSKEHAFKVYHTGTAFYFASGSNETTTSWVDHITKATLNNSDSWERANKKDGKVDESKHFSETDYSDEEASVSSTVDDNINDNKQLTASKYEKTKPEKTSKFGSLKKFAHRMHKSDSKENVSQSSTSLDRKWFFSKSSKSKEEKSKAKHSDVPIPTERYRSYRKVPVTENSGINGKLFSHSGLTPILQEESPEKNLQNVAKIKKLDSMESNGSVNDSPLPDLTHKYPKKDIDPMNYMHASFPNLPDIDSTTFITKPSLAKTAPQRPDNLIGFVTLEEFMLKKQEEERRQLYSNRVLMGVERDSRAKEHNQPKPVTHTSEHTDTLQQQLDRIVPDVIYGEVSLYSESVGSDKNVAPAKMEQIQNRLLPKTPVTSPKSPELIQSVQNSETTKNGKYSFKSKKKNDGYEIIKYDEEDDVNPTSSKPEFTIPAPPKGAKRLFSSSKDAPEKTPLLSAQDDGRYAKDSGNVFEEDQPSTPSYISSTTKTVTKKDFGYETIYGNSSTSSEASNTEYKPITRKPSIEHRKPVPPPKLVGKPNGQTSKQSVSRQSSMSTPGDRKSSGVDTKPVFKQGDSPEKFWLDSLRRNDKVYSSKSNDHSPSSSIKSDKFFTKHTEPSTYMKSSEATIVKSDKMQSKPGTTVTEQQKSLKSATQYIPLSLPMSPNRVLKTSPQFELSLDAREPAQSASSISKIRHMFQHGNNTSTKLLIPPASSIAKEKTLLGSPRLHRAIFRKHHNNTSPDEWAQDIVYSKVAPPTDNQDETSNGDSYLFSVSANDTPLVGASNLMTPDYPHLPLPPTFVAEKYSLADLERNAFRKNQTESQK